MDTEPIRRRFELLAPFLDERSRRLHAAAEAIAFGHGGITAVSNATGVSRRAIGVGLKELADPESSIGKQIEAEEAAASVRLA